TAEQSNGHFCFPVRLAQAGLRRQAKRRSKSLHRSAATSKVATDLAAHYPLNFRGIEVISRVLWYLSVIFPNPKSECRMSKSETSIKLEIPPLVGASPFRASFFDFVSFFLFRFSDLLSFPRRTCLDLDIHSRRQAQLVQSLDRLGRGLHNIDHPLVRA